MLVSDRVGRPLLLLLPLLGLGAAPGGPGAETTLRVVEMTFVGSRGELTEVVLRARRAVLYPATDLADMEEVRASGRDDSDDETFELECDRAKLNTETNDFRAEGNVKGVTSSGEHYTADWVKYHHDQGLLMSDGPVVVRDGTGTFRGDGFRYHVRDKRFQLLGRVRMVQTR